MSDSGGGSILGVEPDTSFHGIEAGIVNLIIFIFTGVAARVMVLTGSEVDTFFITLLVLLLWIIFRRALQTASDAMQLSRAGEPLSSMVTMAAAGPGEDDGWADSWAALLDFVSRILVLLVFQFAGQLIFQEWALVGVTTQETFVLLVLLALVFFPVYLWIHRTWQANHRREREAFQYALQVARDHHQRFHYSPTPALPHYP